MHARGCINFQNMLKCVWLVQPVRLDEPCQVFSFYEKNAFFVIVLFFTLCGLTPHISLGSVSFWCVSADNTTYQHNVCATANQLQPKRNLRSSGYNCWTLLQQQPDAVTCCHAGRSARDADWRGHYRLLLSFETPCLPSPRWNRGGRSMKLGERSPDGNLSSDQISVIAPHHTLNVWQAL